MPEHGAAVAAGSAIAADPVTSAPGRGTARAALAIAIAAVAFAAFMPASAQVTATRDYLDRMDADGDGRVSLPEYLDWMGYAFRGMDRDGDGVLASHELPGGRGGPITAAQHRARLADRFAKQDVDGDGTLDAKELAAPPQH